MGKTVAEKIFDAHLVDNPSGDIHVIRLDAVFCHEITTPSAINDLVERGIFVKEERFEYTSDYKALVERYHR